MKPWYRRSVLLFMLLAPLAVVTPARADRCHRVRATIDLAKGTISGNFGLEGTVVFTQDSPGTPPPTAPPGSSVFSGMLDITTQQGSLRLREPGCSPVAAATPTAPS
jgi:hypothetical protein